MFVNKKFVREFIFLWKLTQIINKNADKYAIMIGDTSKALILSGVLRVYQNGWYDFDTTKEKTPCKR